MLVGGAKALAPMIVEFVFSAVNRMNAKGAIQMIAIPSRMIQRITSTVSKPACPCGSNTMRRAYARAQFWDERMRVMQWWADQLDE